MRNSYTAQLEQLNDDLCALADAAESAMRDAAAALLDPDLVAAEAVISRGEDVSELGMRCEERAVTVLALQAPVAADLRRVFSAMRISADLARKAGLAVHIAEAARRRYPDPIVPDSLRPHFLEMRDLCIDMSHRVGTALRTNDMTDIEYLTTQNSRVDELKNLVVAAVSDDDQGRDVMNAVDIALLGRYFERYADQTIDVASRIVFFVRGHRQLA